jgi:uncharacterized membrane protein YhaH (DUF805 family)
MGFQEAVRAVLGKYSDFSGRARRSEYWFWSLALFIAYIVAVILFVIFKPLGILAYLVVFLGAIVPSLAVGVRRLHDTNKSGWWLLIGLVPFVGGLILLVFMCIDGDPAPNQYGPPPKGGSVGYGEPAYPPPPPPPPPPPGA